MDKLEALLILLRELFETPIGYVEEPIFIDPSIIFDQMQPIRMGFDFAPQALDVARGIPVIYMTNNDFGQTQTVSMSGASSSSSSALISPTAETRQITSTQVENDLYIKNCYQTLGLPYGASKKDIRDAYFKKAKSVHPDRSEKSKDEAHKEFSQLTKAYTTLMKRHNEMADNRTMLSQVTYQPSIEQKVILSLCVYLLMMHISKNFTYDDLAVGSYDTKFRNFRSKL